MTKHLKDLNIVTEIFVNCNVPTTIAAVKLLNIWYHRSGNIFNFKYSKIIEILVSQQHKQ